MTVRLKPGVSLDNVHPKMFLAIGFAAPIWERFGTPELWITGANEEGHATGARGFHRLPDGTCQAVDLRTWNIPRLEDRHAACTALAQTLGAFYDVLYERPGERGEHAHCQWDPERVGTR
jgi:hypothetical protein